MHKEWITKMTTWKLMRHKFGRGEFVLTEGEHITVGRGANNNITLTSIVVSRNHCILKVLKEKVLVTDLKSSNGVYVGTKKIPQNTPFELQESDVIGFGWTIGAPAADISDEQKYVFKLVKEAQASSANRIRFQSENEDSSVEAELAALEQGTIGESRNLQSPILETKPNLKRKLDKSNENEDKLPEIKKSCINTTKDVDIISISDSENECKVIENPESSNMRIPKIEPVSQIPCEVDIKIENKPESDEDFEAFKVKQEYYDVEPIEIESDNESDDDQWAFRLSQSSPGKPVIKAAQTRKSDISNIDDNSYSQLDDFLDDEEILDDIIFIPPQPPDGEINLNINTYTNSEIPENLNLSSNNVNQTAKIEISVQSSDTNKSVKSSLELVKEKDKFLNIVPSKDEHLKNDPVNKTLQSLCEDQLDGIAFKEIDIGNTTISADVPCDKVKKTQVIDLPLQSHRKKSGTEIAGKSKSISKSSKEKRQSSSSKRHISNSQKEERKKKLKEIAEKEKSEAEKRDKQSSNLKPDKTIVNAKVTASNRGAFLSDVAPTVSKPVKKKESPQKTKDKKIDNDTPPKNEVERRISNEDIENRKKTKEKSKSDPKSSSAKNKLSDSKHKSATSKKPEITPSNIEPRKPLKSLKPLTESEESFSGKPFSKVEPLTHEPLSKPKKKVRFSEQAPIVHEFFIEEGNQMKKTSLTKTRLITEHKPVFSLEKITLMKILRWNPYWLEEQMNIEAPPPILGHNNTPMAIFHSFKSHSQYVQQVGDLLLMEIWDSLTQGHLRLRNQRAGLQMEIDMVPQTPTQERNFELFNISVNISLPHSEKKAVPRMGEIMIVDFGQSNEKNRRFFFVHNVKPFQRRDNIHQSYTHTISLHSCYTEKMKSLQPGQFMVGYNLAYINNELMLFNAIEYLAGSPLSEAILRPEPRHFVRCDPNLLNTNVQWTKTLNRSQQLAVNASLAAALGDRPGIQMIQGPPGTGKSSVICAIVMSYFYDSNGRKHQNRGKIMICATSNTAVDEIVLRLLNIRKDLPKSERFRMVRVGREDAMNVRARDVSSQMLAQRDANRVQEPANPAACEEIRHLIAKINMWKTQAEAANNPERAAFCQTRVKQYMDKLELVRNGSGGGGGGMSGGGGGGALSGEALSRAERRIIEGADIVATTLASAHHSKMRGLKRRIALCIVDEAGQAIEPETLIPLTLDVTRLTLIGDPQQLPGFICSQRAKKHGLGESLFSRLASCAEGFEASNAVHMLDQQYRMHRHIADFPNRAFYAGRVSSSGPPRPDIALPPYKLLAICSGDRGQVMGANEMEAWAVSRVVCAVAAVVARGNTKLSIAVITPYNAHKELIKANLKAINDPACAQVEVNSVDSFQGQERDVVIVSLARSHGVGFLTDAGRMNVMLTRARHALLVCLNPYAVMKNPLWRSLVEDAQKRNLFRELPNRMCQPTSKNNIIVEDILSYINDNQNEH